MERKQILEKLINMEEDVDKLNFQLSQFGWDCNEDLVIVNRWQVAKILTQYIEGKLRQELLGKWANAVECREDIGMEPGYRDVISAVIFELANPDVIGMLTKEKAKILRGKLT